MATEAVTSPIANRSSLTRFAWLSVSAAVLTIGLKAVAYLLTGSVGLLSDALESLVNLAGGLMALAMLTIAARPADEEHAFGHSKAEYFSSGVEGTLILIAAVSIGVAGVQRLIAPRPLEQIGLGLGVSVVASLVNLLVAQILLRAGRRYDSITLRANSQHLMTDVFTSAGVLVGVGAVALTGWQRLDPIVALLVAANIVRSGVRIVADSVSGLMDAGLPDEEQKTVRSVLEGRLQAGVRYHALRTRQSGVRRFVLFHVLVPGQWTVRRGHQLVEAIEADLRRALPNATLFTHLDSLNDPASLDDIGLDRASGQPSPLASDPLPAAPSEIVTIRPSAAIMTRQKLPNFVGISEENAGAQGISMNLVVIPPGGAAQPHLHRGYETAIYLLKGRVETRYGVGLRKSVINEAGDFIFIPANVPHQPVNLSATEPAHAIVARNDANEQESVEPYHPGDGG